MTILHKCSHYWSRFLQSKISFWLQASVWIIGTFFFISHFISLSYTYIQPENIDAVLYKATNPHLKKDPQKPTCSYKFIHSNETLFNKLTSELVKQTDDFKDQGVSNGSYAPMDCNPLFSVAVLVTYRNRQRQLNVFIPYIHNFLRKQNIHYKIYLIEQQDEKRWNKGVLYNIGAKVAAAEKFPCLILQDIDLLPLDRSNIYACTLVPRHLSARVNKLRYQLPYPGLVGGVLALPTDLFYRVGGFSQLYTGWGGEDDDFQRRIVSHGYEVIRFPPSSTRYVMLSHPPTPKDPSRPPLWPMDKTGMDDVRAFYKVTYHRLFTLITVVT